MISNKNIKLASVKDCVGCFACVNTCKKNAIKVTENCDGHYYTEIIKNQCIGCGQCEKVCKKVLMEIGDDDLSKSEVFSAWARNDLYRKNGTSGGIFAALAQKIIESGGCVAGAYFDGKECKHIIVYNIDELIKLQGSKYVTSSMMDIYDEIARNLEKGPVLFSGVGCQCAAVIAYFENSIYKKNLYTVDLVCGGTPSKILLDKFFDQNIDIDKIVSFRSKDKYELIVKRGNKSYKYSGRSLPLDGFNCGMTNRFACYDCKYAHGHRTTDITIGDLWDYSVLPEEHSKGISMAIVHNKRGLNLLSESDIEIKKISWEQALLKNKRTVYGHQHIFLPRVKLAKNSISMDSNRFNKLYCINMTFRDVDLMIFRIYRYIIMRFIDIRAKKYIKRIIKEENE